uniref:Uncharacterized protein n=1 Tax=Streptomyces sp. NBC_00119 TaxID=2975659 RepID=A0AAU1UML2_9ACTN
MLPAAGVVAGRQRGHTSSGPWGCGLNSTVQVRGTVRLAVQSLIVLALSVSFVLALMRVARPVGGCWRHTVVQTSALREP